jgi:hypothetical protein
VNDPAVKDPTVNDPLGKLFGGRLPERSPVWYERGRKSSASVWSSGKRKREKVGENEGE